jgi:signal peptidase II
MEYRKWPRAVAFAGVVVLCAAVDLVTKEIALHKLANDTPRQYYDDRVVEVWPGQFVYKYTLNPGVIFGKFPEYGKVFFFVALAAVPLLIGIFWRMKKPSASISVSLAMILGGTLGNLVDRFRFDAVQDFIYAQGINFAIFNIADSCILIGTILLMAELMVFEEKKKKGVPDAPAAPAGPQPSQPGDTPGPAQPG